MITVNTAAIDDSKLGKPFPKPAMLLKDYLVNDQNNSCSSDGFRSYPRRHCCTTVRLYMEKDRTINKPSSGGNKKKAIPPPKTQKTAAPSATKTSTLRRATAAVVNAMKLFPFGSQSPLASKESKSKKVVFPRSLPRKFLRGRFWKKTDRKGIVRWKTFGDCLVEREIASGSNAATAKSTVTDFTATSESNSNSWSDSDFTVSSDYLQCSSVNSEVESYQNLAAPVSKKHLPSEKTMTSVSNRVSATMCEDSDSRDVTSTTTNSTVDTPKDKWPNEDKEQFSPVSVLDCPFDDEEEASSPHEPRLSRAEGTKRKLMKKIRRLESFTQLELEQMNFLHSNSFQEDNDFEGKVVHLIRVLKSTFAAPQSNGLEFFDAENLLSDFFRERITDKYEEIKTSSSSSFSCSSAKNDCDFEQEIMGAAKDWMNGQARELLPEWEPQKNRRAYLNHVENGGKWKNLDDEKHEVAIELEAVIFTSLLNELFH